MGVDISGINPIIHSTKPEFPANEVWKTMSQEEKDAYFEVSNKWDNENPGAYYASNWWGWRPIHMMCEYVNEEYELNFNMDNWGDNDGGGLEDQFQCDKLAWALEDFLKSSDSIMPEDADRIYVCLGSWVDSNGKFLSQEVIDKHELNEQYRYTEILYGGVVVDNGEIYYSAHSCGKKHLERFIAFLKECGGFEIW